MKSQRTFRRKSEKYRENEKFFNELYALNESAEGVAVIFALMIIIYITCRNKS